MSVDLTVVMDKLYDFETADELAEYFRGYGILAQPRKSTTCAISKFILSETGLSNIATDTTSIAHYKFDLDTGTTVILATFKHSPAMEDFVIRFDTGHYPFLIEEGVKINLNHDHCILCN